MAKYAEYMPPMALCNRFTTLPPLPQGEGSQSRVSILPILALGRAWVLIYIYLEELYGRAMTASLTNFYSFLLRR
jgi:hypothetical protein